MSNNPAISEFFDLYNGGYIPSVGSWVQVDPANQLSTVLNLFNTLGSQDIEIYLLDSEGAQVGNTISLSIGTGQARRIDLADHVPEAALPYEGCLWAWAKGSNAEGSLGLQAMDLDFVDRSRPQGGQVLGSVHLMYDFINTLGLAPYLDLVSPRVLVGNTPEGAPKFQNFVALAHVLVTGTAEPELELTVTNEAGETLAANETVSLSCLGSWFGDLEHPVLFPGLTEFLMAPGADRGYGVLGVREAQSRQIGLCSMIKVVDRVSGSMLVDHLNDRAFARPAMKDQ